MITNNTYVLLKILFLFLKTNNNNFAKIGQFKNRYESKHYMMVLLFYYLYFFSFRVFWVSLEPSCQLQI